MHRVIVPLLAASFISGCGCGGIQRPSTSDMVLTGTVSRTSGMAAAEALDGAEIRASVDRNHNGVIDGDEAVTATADADGKYRLQMKVNKGERVVVRFAGSGVAPAFKTVDAGPWAELPLNATLREMDSLDCDETTNRCGLDGNKLSLTGLGAGMSGSARVFNPVKETSSFPGGFADNQGNLLISGVFGAVQLEDGFGNPVDTLAAPADLRMRVPQETWSQIVDLQPGDDRIQIPLYSFDDVKGEWVREGDGYLETPAGAIVPESQLPAIRAGTFSDGLNAAGQVSHFSYWNIDWPVETKQCLTGVVVADDGKPAEGATVLVSGATYTGASTPQTVGADGKFCAEVMRSEAAGESVDNDDVLGETQKVRLRIAYGGKLYDGGVHDMPVTPATCGTSGCLDLGEVKLTQDQEITPDICTIKGRVLLGTGAPLEGAAVFFNDPSVPEEIRNDLCGFAGLNCTLLAVSGADGSYEVKTPVLDGATVFAFTSTEDQAQNISYMRIGFSETQGCPAGGVDLRMTEGFASVTLTPAVSGQQLSWTPSRNVHVLMVMSAAGEPKWQLTANDNAGFAGPVTYGTVPANATQTLPATGAPPPLASGDRLLVTVAGELEGMPLFGAGSVDVP